MPRVFLSYRRDDAGGYAGWLQEHLAARFGPESVFWDLTSITPGADFVSVLDEALATCDALMALIGRHWLTLRSAGGIRRIDEADDFVRLEIATALGTGVPVIPVLVDGAELPDEAELPEPLRALAGCAPIRLTRGQFAADLDRLIAAVKGVEARSIPARPASEVRLPPAATEFVGRADEKSRLQALVEGGTRLITVTGPGGTGKTRLAIEVARAVAATFPHGVYFVDLAPLSDPSLIATSIADALSVRQTPGAPPTQTLIDHLRDRALLLLLDNLEHLQSGTGIIGTLLTSCPHLAALATSRRVLRLQGEHVFPLAPLSLPDPDDHDPQHLLRSDAIRLFVERGAAAKAGFRLTAENAEPIAAICTQLEGLPLALELAAARLRLFPPRTLRQRLEHRLQTLVGGAQNAVERQKTLRATIAWSYDLLHPPEQRLLNELAVFPAGCTFEAVEAVWDGPEDVVAGLETLVDQSLLRQVGEDEPRFTMLQTVREFALEKLANGDEVRGRAARFLEALVSAAGTRRNTPEWRDSLARLDAEYDNIRSILEWATTHRLETAFVLVGSLGDYWRTRGYWTEGRSWIERTLAAAEADRTEGTPRLRAKALRQSGRLSIDLAEYEHAEHRLAEALDLYRDLDDPEETALVLDGLGQTKLWRGRLDEAGQRFEQALEIARSAGDRAGVSRFLNNLGVVAYEQKEYDRARALWTEALALQRAMGADESVAMGVHNLAVLARMQGDFGSARSLLDEGLAIRRRLGDSGGTAMSLDELAFVERSVGRPDTAAQLHREALKIHRELGSKYNSMSSLLGLAAIAAANRQYDRALCLASAVEHLEPELSINLSQSETDLRDATLEGCRTSLPAVEFQAARHRGEMMTWEDAVAFALDSASLTAPSPLTDSVV